MAGNRPARERFDFSLDARQVAAVILGSLGALAMAFFLGHAIGQRVADRPAAVARPAAQPPPADPLAVLDQAPRPDGGDGLPPKLSFHDTLTSPKPPQDSLPPAPRTPPPEAKAAAPAAAVAAAAAPPKGPDPKASDARPPETRPAAPEVAKPTPAPAPKVAVAPVPPPKAAVAPASTPKGASASAATPPPRSGASVAKANWVVQVGSTQDRTEAERIAARFAGRGAKVVVADVPGKGRWYRVRMGSFEARETADRYLKDLERTTGAKGFVAPAN
jgi:cell division septation protein DedD